MHCMKGPEMLEKANIAVEQAGRGGGVYPEVLFEVARQWQWLHEKVNVRDIYFHVLPA